MKRVAEPVPEPIWILLASYNGERFLPALLDSLRAQTDGNWKLLAADDVSDDGTMAQLRAAAAVDRRIEILDSPVTHRLGACANFARLLHAALEGGAHSFALCDQDDVWHADKLARMRSALRAGEVRCGTTTPLLAYADLRLVDAAGHSLGASHFGRAGAAQARTGADTWLLAHSLIPGCAMLGNRALLQAALPLPATIHYHDWWLVLIAAASGEALAVDAELTDYRQHGGNLIGAAAPLARAAAFLRRFSARSAAAHSQYWLAVAQAAALLDRAAAGSLRLHPHWEEAALIMRDRLGSVHRIERIAAAAVGPVQRLGFARRMLMLACAAAAPLPLKSCAER